MTLHQNNPGEWVTETTWYQTKYNMVSDKMAAKRCCCLLVSGRTAGINNYPRYYWPCIRRQEIFDRCLVTNWLECWRDARWRFGTRLKDTAAICQTISRTHDLLINVDKHQSHVTYSKWEPIKQVDRLLYFGLLTVGDNYYSFITPKQQHSNTHTYINI